MDVEIKHIKIDNIDTSYSFNDCEIKQPIDNSANATLRDLIPNTYYFCRITSEQQLSGGNANGSSSEWRRFKTKGISIDTCYVADITPSSANIVSDMTIGDAHIKTSGISYKANGSSRWVDFPNANGESHITQSLTRLKHKSKYDYRTYLQAQECDTIFSETKTFETKQLIGIDSIAEISQLSAIINGYTFSKEDFSLTKLEYGIVDSRGNCNYENECDLTILESGLFGLKIAGLFPKTKYSVKAIGVVDDDTITDTRIFSTPAFFNDDLTVEDNRTNYITAHVGVTPTPTKENIETYGFVITLYRTLESEYKYIAASSDGDKLQTKLVNLALGKDYYVCPYTLVDGQLYLGDFKNFTTRKYYISQYTTTTQTSATITVTNVINSDDETARIESLSCEIDGKRYNIVDQHNGKGTLTLKNLWGTYTISKFSGSINGSWYTWETNSANKPFTFSTKPVKIGFNSKVGQTYFDLNWTIDKGDATYLGSKVVITQKGSSIPLIDSEISDVHNFLINELLPGTEYTVKVYVKTKEGGLSLAYTTDLRTDTIDCTTLNPTNISNRSAKLNGEIFCDSYSSTEFGFEWKQMQGWTSSPAFTKGVKLDDGAISVALVNGMLEPNTDYQYRVAVRYQNCIYASEDWKTFRTESEFIYFPASVFTLFRTDRENNELVLCGYYIAGSEMVVEQGYEYWPVGNQSSRSSNPQNAVILNTDESMHHTFSIGELQGGNYAIRAFVKTESGETLYGSTLGFSVSEDGYSGVESVDNDEIIVFVEESTLKISNARNLSCHIFDGNGILYAERYNMSAYEEFLLNKNKLYIVRFSNGEIIKIRI